MRINYLSLAIRDLTEIRDYIASHYPELAQPIGKKLRNSINGLAQFPNLGRPGRMFETRELIVPNVGKKTYIVVYRIVGDVVQVLRVLAGSRDIDRILEEGFGEED